jgi:hypothetical protein
MTQNRDELNSKIAEAMKDRATTWGGLTKWDELAEACLSAIEQSGCTICPNEPDAKMASAGIVCWTQNGSLKDTYKAMLSSSPFTEEKADG